MAGRYTEVVRSQHITQSDTRIFGRSSVAETSSVDGQAAFFRNTADHSVNEFFQSFEMLREEGMPTSLPRTMRADLRKDTAVVALQEREDAASDAHEKVAAQKERGNLLKRLERRALTDISLAGRRGCLHKSPFKS